jgi:putative transposase
MVRSMDLACTQDVRSPKVLTEGKLVFNRYDDQYFLSELPFHLQMLLPQPAYGFLCVIFRETLEKWSCELIEFKGEADHVQLLIQTNPTVELSKLINNLKTVSSRLIRRDFGGYLSRIYRKPVFWRRSYCLISSGGATIEKLRKYIEEQGSE